MHYMRDHLEGTELNMANDVGVDLAMPYRWRPMTWEIDGVEYCNERTTATANRIFICNSVALVDARQNRWYNLVV